MLYLMRAKSKGGALMRTPQTPRNDEHLTELLEDSVNIARHAAATPQPAAPAVSAVRFSEGPLGELFEAMAQAQAEMGHAVKNGDNPFFSSRYADLSACIDVARGPLTRHGIAVIQMPWTRNGNAVVTTRFGHASGEWMESDLELPPQAPKRKFNGRGERAEDEAATGPTPHAYGSAISFARRYAYNAISGLAVQDDDGNAASYDDAEAHYAQPQRQPVQRQAAPEQRAATRRTVNGGEGGPMYAGIDIGPNQPNTRAASDYVAASKLDKLRAPRRAATSQPAAAPPAAPFGAGTKAGEIRAAFQGLRLAVGAERYDAELARAGVTDPIDLRQLSAVTALYQHIAGMSEVA